MHTYNRTNHIQSRLLQVEETTESETFDLRGTKQPGLWLADASSSLSPCCVYLLNQLFAIRQKENEFIHFPLWFTGTGSRLLLLGTIFMRLPRVVLLLPWTWNSELGLICLKRLHRHFKLWSSESAAWLLVSGLASWVDYYIFELFDFFDFWFFARVMMSVGVWWIRKMLKSSLKWKNTHLKSCSQRAMMNDGLKQIFKLYVYI